MTRRAHSISDLAKDQRGAAAVEFAIVSGVFVTALLGIAYIGIMLFTNAALHFAVERSARLATINTSITQSAVSTALNGYLSSLGVPAATVTYSVANGAFPVAHINATLSQSYSIPFIPTVNITYVADAYVPQGA
jgi:Flp pilus assembly protein TadG